MYICNVHSTLSPGVIVTISGLNPDYHYDVCIAIVSEDSYEYEFIDNEWIKKYVSTKKPNKERQMLVHGDSPNTGRFWMSGPISLKNARISHYDVATDTVSI